MNLSKILKKQIIILSLFAVVVTVFLFGSEVVQATAMDVGFDHVENTELGKEDPRVMMVKLLNIAFTFLGMIAVGIFMYAGWLWMTSNGQADKVDKAKNTIRNAVIGLVVIFASYGIVFFIINSMGGATGVPSGSCPPASRPAGIAYCCAGSWQTTPCSSSGSSGSLTESCSSFDDTSCPTTTTCPNSPGECSVTPTTSTVLSIDCSTSECNAVPACRDSGGNCFYATFADYNVCASSTDATAANVECSLPVETISSLGTVVDGLNRPITAYCDNYKGVGRWHMNTSVSCPANWTSIFGGKCYYNPSFSVTCDICSSGFDCLDDNDSDVEGICAVNKNVCPSGSSCNGGEVCEIVDPAVCECCCRVAEAEADCCEGLTCSPGGCGDPDDGYGSCSGCRILDGSGDVDYTASNEACNCFGTVARFCDVNFDVDKDGAPEGRCGDCSVLSGDPVACSETTTCCVDAENGNRCIGGTGTKNTESVFGFDPPVLMQAEDDEYSYCSYFSCNAGSPGGWSGDIVASSSTVVYTSSTTAEELCTLSDTAVGASCFDGDVCEANSCSKGYKCPDPGNNWTDPQDYTFSNTSDTCGFCCCELFDAGQNNKPGNVLDVCRELNLNMYCGVDDDISSNCYTAKATDTPPPGHNNTGTCCGCSADAECSTNGDPQEIGCGNDSCCHNRPKVIAMLPADDATNTCRNALIEVTFDQSMDVYSFKNNAILLGDYGTNSCPEGTTYLAANGRKDQGKFARSFSEFRNFLARKINNILPTKLAIAYTSVIAGNNFCQVPGQINGYHTPNGDGILTFSPQRALDANMVHYMILKGDEGALDSSEGIKNKWEIAMNTDNFAAGLPAHYVANPLLAHPSISYGVNTFPFTWSGVNNIERRFNEVDYNNAFVWSFQTAADQGTGGGLCQLSDVNLHPDSYLFKTNVNDLNEDDDRGDDFARDSDKLFVADSKADNGQKIAPIESVYDWRWVWGSSYPQVATTTVIDILPSTMSLVRVGDVVNGKTFVSVECKVVVDTIFNTPAGTTMSEDISEVYVFLCDNPWPPIASDGGWSPWIDRAGNCNAAMGDPSLVCPDTNYELYYCKDRGMTGTYDDLPTILNNATIRKGSFAEDDEVVSAKEIYYFRGAALNVSAMETAINVTTSATASGQSIVLDWAIPTTASGTTLYWGNYADTYSNSVAIKVNTDACYDTTENCFDNNNDNVDCSMTADNIECALSGLENNIMYYINVTVTDSDGAESEYFGELATSTNDTIAPDLTGYTLRGTSTDGAVDLAWNEYTDEAVNYRLHYSSNEESAVAKNYPYVEDLVDDLEVELTGLTNATPYYFAIGVVDRGGNEEISNYITRTPFSIPTNLVAIASSTNLQAVTLAWDLVDEGVLDVQIDWESEDGLVFDNESFGGFETSYEVTGLRQGTLYDFWVTVTNTDPDNLPISSPQVTESERLKYQTKVVIP